MHGTRVFQDSNLSKRASFLADESQQLLLLLLVFVAVQNCSLLSKLSGYPLNSSVRNDGDR